MKIIKLILVCFIISLVSCKKKIDKEKESFAQVITLPGLKYLPQKGSLYLYKPGTDFTNLIQKKDTIVFFYYEDRLNMTPRDNDEFSPEYDYRLILDDTLCFDLSDFHTIPDTMGRSMVDFVIRNKLVSFKCNDSIYRASAYMSLDPPFKARRIIKKGQYDQ